MKRKRQPIDDLIDAHVWLRDNPVVTTINSQGRKIRLGKNMRATLEYTARTPEKWHDVGKGRAAKMAVKRLERAGLVEVQDRLNRFRVKP